MARELGVRIARIARIEGGRVLLEVPSVAPGHELAAVALARPRQRMVTWPTGTSLEDEPWAVDQRVLVGFLGGDVGSPVVLAALA